MERACAHDRLPDAPPGLSVSRDRELLWDSRTEGEAAMRCAGTRTCASCWKPAAQVDGSSASGVARLDFVVSAL